jgi:uncharacterized protein
MQKDSSRPSKHETIELEPEHLAEVLAILDAMVPGAQVVAFGSRVTGDSRATSDLDLAVRADRALSLRELRLLKESFEDSALPIRVDVVDWHSISEEFRNVINRQSVLLRSSRRPSAT